MWKLPTYKDAFLLTNNPRVQCTNPKCLRWVQADMLYDLRSLPQGIRNQMNIGSAPFHCDGCIERAVQTGRIKMHVLAQHLGAPLAQINIIQLKREP